MSKIGILVASSNNNLKLGLKLKELANVKKIPEILEKLKSIKKEEN